MARRSSLRPCHSGRRMARKPPGSASRIPFNCPYADVYPHFVRGDLTRLDGQPLGEATSPGTFDGRPAVQISRRSNRRDQAETPLLKALKVLEWLRRRP